MFASSLKKIIQFFKYLAFTSTQQQAFLEDIAALVDDGVMVNSAVEIIHKTTAGLSVEAAAAILTKLAEGRPFADGMRNWFPPHIVEIVRAGEAGGSLARSMMVAVKALGQRSKAFAILVNTLFYPLLVFCLGLMLTIFVKHSVLTSYAAIKPVNQWPDIGQTVMLLANFIQSWWWMLLLLIIVLLAFLAHTLQTYIGQGRLLIDQIPLLSLYRKLTAARFMEILGLLITNGVVFKNALKILQQDANPYLASHLLTMEFRLSGGKENIAEVLDTGLLDETDLIRLRVIAQGSGFEYALIRQGQKAGEQSMQTINIASKFFGMLLLTMGAGLAAYLVVAIYSVGASLSGM